MVVAHFPLDGPVNGAYLIPVTRAGRPEGTADAAPPKEARKEIVMAIRIELYRVMPREYRCGGRACDLQFGVDIDLNGDADAACMAAGYVCAGLGAMYGGDNDKKVVAYVNGKRVAQFVGRLDEGAAAALERLFGGCRPNAGDFDYYLRQERAAYAAKRKAAA